MADQYAREMAIKMAYPFGGFAPTKYKPVLNDLEAEGLVEINCYCSIMEGYDYSLTNEGRKLVRK